MNAIETLNTYRRTVAEIDELEHQLDQISPSGRPAGLHGAGRREEGPSTNNGMAAALQLADGLSEMIRRKREMLASLGADVYTVLQQIGNGREYQIVQQYYMTTFFRPCESSCRADADFPVVLHQL